MPGKGLETNDPLSLPSVVMVYFHRTNAKARLPVRLRPGPHRKRKRVLESKIAEVQPAYLLALLLQALVPVPGRQKSHYLHYPPTLLCRVAGKRRSAPDFPVHLVAEWWVLGKVSSGPEPSRP